MTPDQKQTGSVQSIHPLSPLQHGMLFDARISPHSGVYIEQRWCTIEGELDVPGFQAAWNESINNHDALRAEFHWEETEQPAQVIYDRVEPSWQITTDDFELETYLQEDRNRGFRLDKAPLVRFALHRISHQVHQFVWTYHHLLMDGWCNAVLIQEVLQRYEQERLPSEFSNSFRYASFIDWLSTRPPQDDRSYWMDCLLGFAEPTLLQSAVAPPVQAIPTSLSHGESEENSRISEQTAESQSGYTERTHQIDAALTSRL
ncbi:MAG: condensation domain-containing protein, partial [Planctomycetota bacterium]